MGDDLSEEDGAYSTAYKEKPIKASRVGSYGVNSGVNSGVNKEGFAEMHRTVRSTVSLALFIASSDKPT